MKLPLLLPVLELDEDSLDEVLLLSLEVEALLLELLVVVPSLLA
jgi:hypothetical protein